MSDALEARELLVNVEGDLRHRRWVVNTAVDRIERFYTPDTPIVSDDPYAQVADLAQHREAKENNQLSTQTEQPIATADVPTDEMAQLSARAAELAVPSPIKLAA
jgi:hypothetical protein